MAKAKRKTPSPFTPEVIKMFSDDSFYTGETFFSLPIKKIVLALSEKCDQDEVFTEKFRPILERIIGAKREREIVEIIDEHREVARAVWNSCGFLNFGIDKLEGDENFRWILRLRVHCPLAKVHAAYRFFFVYSPIWHFDALDSIDRERQVVRENPSLDLETDDAKNPVKTDMQKLKELDERERLQIARYTEQKDFCKEVTFVGYTQKSEYKNTETGRDTVIFLKIPRNIVNLLNDRGDQVGNYRLRFEIEEEA